MLGIQKRLYQQTSMGILLKSLKIAYMLLKPFMEEVLPESREEKYYDYSDLKEIDEAAEEYLMVA